MSTFWSILRMIGFLVILAAVCVGALFGWAWHLNGPGEVLSAAWAHDQADLGDQATLDVRVRLPWHRELTSAIPGQHPASLQPIPHGAKLAVGDYGLAGYREWSLSIPLAVIAPRLEDGLRITLPLDPDRADSPSGVLVPLPPLRVDSPTQVSTTLLNPSEKFVLEEIPEAETIALIAVEGSGIPWISGSGVLLGCCLLGYALYRLTRKHVPTPWERALARLDSLEKTATLPPSEFYVRLLDILKAYLAGRFALPTQAETNAELVASVGSLESVRAPNREALTFLARSSNEARFASQSASSPTTQRNAITLVRDLVVDTTPEKDDA